MSIKYHQALKNVTPDTVAECWDGVYSSGDLYEQLWGCVDSYDEYDREDCGPHDVIGMNSVAKFWDCFSEQNQRRLNELAEQREQEFQKWLAKDVR
jgi:hypothetical protein